MFLKVLIALIISYAILQFFLEVYKFDNKDYDGDKQNYKDEDSRNN